MTMGTGLGMFILSQIIAVPLSNIFVGYDRVLMDMTVHGLRLFAFSFVLVGFNIFASSFFTALNDGGVSAIISFLRTIVFQLIPVLLLPVFFGLDGVWCAVGVSEFGAFIVSVCFLIGKRKKYCYF